MPHRLVVLDVLQVAFITVSGVALFVVGQWDSKWVWGANVARIIEAVLCGTAAWLAAGVVGYM
ncbi:MAG: hypothetical protein L0Y64_10955 [Myxococcaceae bacterium]|nr:hypothetical protein [Myxococcaceae bacterium]